MPWKFSRRKRTFGRAASRLGAGVLAVACLGGGTEFGRAENPPSAAASASTTSTGGATSTGEPSPPASVNPASPAANAGNGSSPRAPGGRTRDGRSDAKSDAARVREGTRWQNQRGFFTLVGDRVTFTTTDRAVNVVALENLNLERVVKTLEESRTVADSDKLEWVVDGTVTEFRGANFLSVTRSVLVTRPRKVDVVQ